MKIAAMVAFCGLVFLAGCGGLSSDRQVVVQGVGADDMLKLRGGPGLEYRVKAGLPDDTRVNVIDCVTEIGQRWCRVSLTDAPGLRGYVSADYLSDN